MVAAEGDRTVAIPRHSEAADRSPQLWLSWNPERLGNLPSPASQSMHVLRYRKLSTATKDSVAAYNEQADLLRTKNHLAGMRE